MDPFDALDSANKNVKVLDISLPEYTIEAQLDYDKIGSKLDSLATVNLAPGEYVERSIGLIDHPDKGIDQLTDIILKQGTDKYEAGRISMFDEEFSCYQFDIHANEFEIKDQSILFRKDHHIDSYYGQSMYCFHQLALIDRGYSVRIGLSMIYEKRYLLPPLEVKKCGEAIQKYSKYLFRFKDNHPLQALTAIVQIR